MRTSIVVTLVALAISAHAGPADDHLATANAAYQRGDYDTASAELERAYALDPRSELLYGWAQAERLGGHCEAASDLYRRYLATKPNRDQVIAAQAGLGACAVKPVRPAVLEAVPWYRDGLGDGLALGGLVGIGAGTGFLAAARSSDREADSAMQRDDKLAFMAERDSRTRIGYITGGIGLALIAASVVRYSLRHDTATRIAVGTTGTTIFVVGGF